MLQWLDVCISHGTGWFHYLRAMLLRTGVYSIEKSISDCAQTGGKRGRKVSAWHRNQVYRKVEIEQRPMADWRMCQDRIGVGRPVQEAQRRLYCGFHITTPVPPS